MKYMWLWQTVNAGQILIHTWAKIQPDNHVQYKVMFDKNVYLHALRLHTYYRSNPTRKQQL